MDSDLKGSHEVFSDGTYGSAFALDPAATDPDAKSLHGGFGGGTDGSATTNSNGGFFELDSRWHPSLGWKCWTWWRRFFLSHSA